MARHLEIANFPRDGLWYIRWVESLPPSDAGLVKDRLRVVLCRVSADAGSFPTMNEVRGRLGVPRVAEVPIECLPSLRIGSVWQGGVYVGRMIADDETFSFELPEAFYRSAHGLHRVNASFPRWQDGKIAPAQRLLIDDYPTGAGVRSVLTVLSENDRLLLIPASEVIRVFLAPSQRLLRTMLSGPWSHTRFMLLNRQTALRQGAWHIHLEDAAASTDALHLGNLHYEFNRRGFDAARRVLSGVAEGHLIGMLPFDRGTLPMSVRAVEIRPDTYLCLEILRVGWPRTDQLPVIVHGGVAIESPIRLGDTTQRPDLMIPAAVQIGLSVVPPASSGGAVAITLPGTQWDNLPPIDRRPARTIPLKVQRSRIVLSPGFERPGTGWAEVRDGQGRLRVRSVGHVCDDMLETIPRFEALRACLRSLQARKRILHWEPIEATEERWRSQRGNLPVWAFEQKGRKGTGEIAKTWALVVAPGHARPRAMLICRIEVDLETTLFWFELEPVASKGSPALIILCDHGKPEPRLTDIFRWTRARRGFKKLRGLSALQDCNWRTYKHRYVRDPVDRVTKLGLNIDDVQIWMSEWMISKIKYYNTRILNA